MKDIASLINTFNIPSDNDVSIRTEGFALWVAWDKELPVVVSQTFQDYSGIPVVSIGNQSLWFFFSSEILLAIAKLYVWTKFNPTTISIQAFPATLLIDPEKALSLQFDDVLKQQSLSTSHQNLSILIHPKLQELGQNIPGLTFNKEKNYNDNILESKLAKVDWAIFLANPKLPYPSTQSWYAIVHPLGSIFDKKYQAGWRFMFAELEAILQRLKLKYSISENYLMIPVENISTLREWTQDFIQTLYNVKTHMPDKYWPCVSAIVDRKGLNFNNELPRRVNINWDGLTPNFPYINYRNAYLLGKDFVIQDLNFSINTSTIDNWCTVINEDFAGQANRINVLLPDSLVSGYPAPCFYCGIKSHESGNCPTRKFNESDPKFWDDFNTVDIDDINSTFRYVEMEIKKNGTAAYKKILEEDTVKSQVLEGILNINSSLQLRALQRIWALSGKQIDAPLDQNAFIEDSACWALLDRLKRAKPSELLNLEKEITVAMSTSPRDWRLKSLAGFVAIERSDYPKALQYWKEAETHTTSVLHQAWHYFLQARVLEVQARYEDAIELYSSAQKFLVQWAEPSYRIMVCRVKMGFSEQAFEMLLALLREDKRIFNKVLLDSELERGHLQLMSMLYPLWVESLGYSSAEKNKIMQLLEEVQQWFPPEHPIAHTITKKLEDLIKVLETQNYLASQNIVTVRPVIEEDLSKLKKRELEQLKTLYKGFLSSLEAMRDEASWFPLQNALTSFNKEFNECASILNWAFSANFNTAESFRRANEYIEPVKEQLKTLSKQLSFIRTARDSTLFVILLVKSFLWIEAIGLGLALVIVPLLTFYGDAIGLTWLQKLITQNFWELQSVLLVVISSLALGFAILRTTLIFDKRRTTMIEKAKAEREVLQQERLSKIMKKRQAQQDGLSAQSIPKGALE